MEFIAYNTQCNLHKFIRGDHFSPRRGNQFYLAMKICRIDKNFRFSFETQFPSYEVTSFQNGVSLNLISILYNFSLSGPLSLRSIFWGALRRFDWPDLSTPRAPSSKRTQLTLTAFFLDFHFLFALFSHFCMTCKSGFFGFLLPKFESRNTTDFLIRWTVLYIYLYFVFVFRVNLTSNNQAELKPMRVNRSPRMKKLL